MALRYMRHKSEGTRPTTKTRGLQGVLCEPATTFLGGIEGLVPFLDLHLHRFKRSVLPKQVTKAFASERFGAAPS